MMNVNNVLILIFFFNVLIKRKIKNGIKYFMIKKNDHMNFLESDTIKKNVEFKNANKLNEKYKHIFFIIPYYSKSILKGNTLTQGISSIWKYFY